MRRVGKGFSGVDTPLFEGMIVAQQVDEAAAEVNVDDVPVGVADEGAASVAVNDVLVAVEEPSIPSPTPPTQPPQTITRYTFHLPRGMIANIDADKDITLQDVADIAKEVVVDAEIKESADVQGRKAESQA
nr:hypothetical protein [Tanacetum cinerariifolium]